MPDARVALSQCSCGRVAFEAAGAPITCAVCYCDSCQEGVRQIEALPQATRIAEPDGGIAYILYRKDRVRCAKGADLLVKRKLTEKTATNRVVATCCNTGMVVNFDDAKHWVSMYRTRFAGTLPPVQARICTKGKRVADDGVSRHPSYPLSFIAKLMGARIAMLFSR